MPDDKVTYRSIRYRVRATISAIKPSNPKKLGYFDAMAATFDLRKKYPEVTFSDEHFDQYCTRHGLARYIYHELTGNHK